MAADTTGRKTLVGIVADRSLAPQTRAAACFVLGAYQRTRQPAGALAVVVADPDEAPALRLEAARAIAGLQARPAFEALVEVLGDPREDPALRAGMAEALGATLDEVAVKPLLSTLADGATDPGVRAACAHALAYHDSPDLAGALFDALEEEDARLRFWGLFALGELASRGQADAGEVIDVAETIRRGDDRVLRGYWSVRRQAWDAAGAARRAVYPVEETTLAGLVGPQAAEDAAMAFAERVVRTVRLPRERCLEVSKEVVFEPAEDELTAFFPWLDARVPQPWEGTVDDLAVAAAKAGDRMGIKLGGRGVLGLGPWRSPVG